MNYLPYPGFGYPTTNNYGWICPKCGTVYSPMSQTCFKCSPNTLTSLTTGA